MNSQSILPGVENQRRAANFISTQSQEARVQLRHRPFDLPTMRLMKNSAFRQAEQFYLQKQIQSQTPMVIVLEDGERVEGQIEWYDRGVLKVRGRAKTLIYKSAIKYMFKLAEAGQ